MNIVVCIKQVPASSNAKVDENGLLKRDGDSKMNPYDLYALETALRLKEETGGKVTVVSMGPMQAQAVIREAYSMGADEGYLLSGREFAGADVLATSHAISQCIKLTGQYDIIICGKQSTDGDTAQVGPEMSERLGLPSVTNVTSIVSYSDKSIVVTRELPTASETLELQFPCLITVEKEIYIPRLPSYIKKKATKDRVINVKALADLEDQKRENYGLTGSPTQVQRIFPPAVNSDRETWTGTASEIVDKMAEKLKERKFI